MLPLETKDLMISGRSIVSKRKDCHLMLKGIHDDICVTSYLKPTIETHKGYYISRESHMLINLPGTGDTMIKKVVPSGGG